MREYLKNLPQEIRDLLHLFGNIASARNMPIYLVGGIVRDLILGVKNLDLDIAVEGDGIKFAEECAVDLKACLIRHRRFGTATLAIRPGLKVDVATARKEFYPQSASLPVVSPGTLSDDLQRRDFTINAMAISITGKDFGGLIDLFGGRSDLAARKIRILHKLSFIDDPTRILRAVRFEKRYNFRLESKTLACLREASRMKMLEKVQPHRLRDELILVLKEEGPSSQIRRIQSLAGFSFFSPRLKVSESTLKLFSRVKKDIEWMQKNYPERRQLDTWLVYLIALLDPLALRDVRAICRKFAFGKSNEKRIVGYKKLTNAFISELGQPGLGPSRIYTMLEPLPYEVIIMLKSKYRNRHLQKNIADFFEIYNGMRVCISGDDLRRIGIAPGPYYKKIFTKVLEAKLEGMVKTREEELALIKKLTGCR